MRGVVCGLWKATTELVRDGTNAWFVPVLTPVGALGATQGPTVAQVRLAVELRQAFRETLPNAQPSTAPAIESPRSGLGSITITSGRKPAVDPIMNDPIPFG